MNKRINIVIASMMMCLGIQAAFSSVAGAAVTNVDHEIAAVLNAGNSAEVNDVSCASATFCATGGSYRDSSGSYQAFVSTFNGTSWRDQEVVAALNVGGQAVVDGINCTSSTFCVAGGVYKISTTSVQSFVSTFNGTSWTDERVGNGLSPVGVSGIVAVSCASSTYCVAGGEFLDAGGNLQPYISIFNGTSWADQAVAAQLNVDGQGVVDTASCPTTTFCVVGGNYTDGSGNLQAFVSTVSGSTVVNVPLAGSFNFGGQASIDEVSCASATFCAASGYYTDSANNFQAFVSTFNGSTWNDREIVASLNSGGNGEANAISCPTTTFCATGGQYADGNGKNQAFVSTFNGSTWTDQKLGSTLNAGGDANILEVSCASATFCIATGRYKDSSGNVQAMVSIYNGSFWADQQALGGLNTGGAADLDSVSCPTVSFCVASGYAESATSRKLAAVSILSEQNAVTYADGGGTGSVPTQASVSQSGTFQVAANTLTESGKTFAGWSDGTTVYQPGATYTMGSTPVTLTATWSAEKVMAKSKTITCVLGKKSEKVTGAAPKCPKGWKVK